MPTYTKTPNGVRAQICVKRIRRSKTFKSMGAARAWAVSQENEILAGDRGEIPNKTFSDLLDRYADTVSTQKKGSQWELVRINLIKRDRIASVRLKDLDATHVSDWRDRRLLDVSGASVNREKNLLAHVCTVAVKEWKWLKVNPFHGVRMPPKGRPRDRIMSEDERKRLGEAADSPMLVKVLKAADFAVETGMRASEICKAEVSGQVAFLPDTKNGESRQVPMSLKALEIWNSGHLTGLTPRQIDANWRKLTKKAGIKNLHFHDTRATAATRLASKLHPLQLAKMFGWKDLKMAMVYYRESPEDIAKMLDTV